MQVLDRCSNAKLICKQENKENRYSIRLKKIVSYIAKALVYKQIQKWVWLNFDSANPFI